MMNVQEDTEEDPEDCLVGTLSPSRKEAVTVLLYLEDSWARHPCGVREVKSQAGTFL